MTGDLKPPRTLEGDEIPWSRMAFRQTPGNRRPRPSDLSAHQRGHVHPLAAECRDEASLLVRRYVDRGLSPVAAKVAVTVGALVELYRIRSTTAREDAERRGTMPPPRRSAA